MGGLVEAVADLFGGGGNDAPPPPQIKAPDPLPAPPSIDDAAKLRDDADKIKKRKGRAATLMTGKEGSGTPDSSAATLLGG